MGRRARDLSHRCRITVTATTAQGRNTIITSHEYDLTDADIDTLVTRLRLLDAAAHAAATTSNPAVGLALLARFRDDVTVLAALAANPGLSRGCRDRASERLAGLEGEDAQ